MIGAKVVAEARSWIGTPYLHQASVKFGGCDCLGLLRGVWRDIYGQEPEKIPAYTPDWSEPARQELLWERAGKHLCAKDLRDESPGDVVLFRMRQGSVAKHLGIIACLNDRASFVHAYSRHGVVESPLSKAWARRIVARFEFPERGV